VVSVFVPVVSVVLLLFVVESEGLVVVGDGVSQATNPTVNNAAMKSKFFISFHLYLKFVCRDRLFNNVAL
jgi:hypothetical protein